MRHGLRWRIPFFQLYNNNEKTTIEKIPSVGDGRVSDGSAECS